MTRKHFETLALIISKIYNWKDKIHTFKGCIELCRTNPNFNPVMFAEACGLSGYYDACYVNTPKDESF